MTTTMTTAETEEWWQNFIDDYAQRHLIFEGEKVRLGLVTEGFDIDRHS